MSPLTLLSFILQADPKAYTRTLNNTSHPASVKEDKPFGAQDDVMPEAAQRRTDVPSLSQLPCPEVAPVTPEMPPKSANITSQKENPPSGTVPSAFSPILRVRPRRPVDARERPHSAFVESELKERSSSTFGSVVALRSSFHQQVQGEMEGTRGFKGFSVTTAKAKDGERPRSGSFVEPLEQAEARKKATLGTDDKLFSGMKGKEELRDLQPRGGGFALGRLKQEGSPPKSSGPPWERRDSSKRTESVKTSKNMADTGPEDVDRNQEVVEEAVEAKEAQEEEGKTCTFGVKLRPTSQSMRFRPDASSNRHSQPPACEEQDDRQQQQETSTTKKLPTNISSAPSNPGDVRLAGGFLRLTTAPHNLKRCTRS